MGEDKKMELHYLEIRNGCVNGLLRVLIQWI